jgi:hypothetical protein
MIVVLVVVLLYPALCLPEPAFQDFLYILSLLQLAVDALLRSHPEYPTCEAGSTNISVIHKSEEMF